jgi:hypothetical protein
MATPSKSLEMASGSDRHRSGDHPSKSIALAGVSAR